MKTGYDQFFKKASEASKTKSHVDARKILIKKSKQKKKSSFPITQIFLFGMIALACLFAFDQSESIEKQLKKIDIGLPFAQAEEKSPGHHDEKVEVKADAKSEVKSDVKPDEADYMFKLAERKKQLDQREEELNKYAAEIARQKEEIEAKLKNLEETRTKISTALEDKIKTDDAKVDTLVQMYSNMKPQQAAKVFETLDEDLVIEILSRMKKKNAADILNLVKAEKAQVLAERYAGYRVPASK